MTKPVDPSFTADNSVQPGGIHQSPGQTTGGNGRVTGEEVEFDVSFTPGLLLPADHYFFVPQVEVKDPNGDFFWLSATKTIPAPADLQSWTRDVGPRSGLAARRHGHRRCGGRAAHDHAIQRVVLA